MNQTIAGHFDGKVIVPDEPVKLPVGQPLRVRIELASTAEPRFADLQQFAVDVPGAPVDLAAQHDHYLYGRPKR